MKKALVCMAGVIFLLTAVSIAAEKQVTEANRGAVLKTASVKTARMNARGKVVEISDKAIKIERIIKGNAEIMEFALESPVADIAVNDSVKIVYSVKEGIWTASRVAKLGAMKNIGGMDAKQARKKPASAEK